MRTRETSVTASGTAVRSLGSIAAASAIVVACGSSSDDTATGAPDASGGDAITTNDAAVGTDASQQDAARAMDATTASDASDARAPIDASDAASPIDASDAAPPTDAAPDAGCVGGCDDANPCTSDACVSGACMHTPNDGAACSRYTGGDYVGGRCSGGSCCIGCLQTGGACETGNVDGVCGQDGVACSACAANANCLAGSCAVHATLAGAATISLGPDVDGDGLADVLVGAETASPNGMGGAGQVTLYSGATMQPIRSWNGETAGDAFGGSIALGPDVDGDARGDVLVGARHFSSSAGKIYLYSGASGALLCSWAGTTMNELVGHYVALGPDADGDGKGDALTSTGSAGGAVTLYSGASCAMVWSLPVVAPAISIGPDTNGDALADAVLGDATNGNATIVSGKDGSQLLVVHNGLGFGASVSLGPDATGDGRGDIVVGWPSFGGNNDGLAQENDGATGALVNTWQGNSQALGRSVVLGPDSDGDGKGDVLILVPGYLNTSARVALESGSSNATIRAWPGNYAAISLGPDADGDGRGDVALVTANGGEIVLYGSKTW
jgi:hypothetical protein